MVQRCGARRLQPRKRRLPPPAVEDGGIASTAKGRLPPPTRTPTEVPPTAACGRSPEDRGRNQGTTTLPKRYRARVTAEPTRNVLGLEPTMTRRSWQDGKYDRTFEHHFLDYVTDGRWLREVAGEPNLVTPLSRPWLKDVASEIDQLLGQREAGDLPAGRVALLVCPVDGDIACGALTARLQVSQDHVVWTDWLWESDQGALSVEHLSEPAMFDRQDYEKQMRMALATVTALPFDELAHRGKRFLWPWEWGWRLPPRGD